MDFEEVRLYALSLFEVKEDMPYGDQTGLSFVLAEKYFFTSGWKHQSPRVL